MRRHYFQISLALLGLTAFAATSAAATSSDTRLVEAVKSGNRTAAIALIAAHADANTPEVDGTTPLHWAVHRDDADLVERLIHAGARAEGKNTYGVTPLEEAAVIGNTAVLKLLLEAGANVNSTNGDGQTALMVIARTSNVAAAKLLLSHGAKVNPVEQWRGQTALMWAAAEGQAAMVKLLVASGAEVNVRSKANNWDRNTTAEGTGLGAKYLPAGGLTALLFAARQGHLDCAQALVEAGADKDLQDPDGISPMITAIVNAHYDVAQYLAERGADVNLADQFGRTALWAAVDMHTLPHSTRPDTPEPETVSSTDLLKTILAHDADPNVQLVTHPPYRSMGDRGSDNILTIGASALLRAAKAGDFVAIRMLLDKGADPNLASKPSVTPLMAAAGVGSRDSDTRGRYKTEQDAIESARMLIAAGADVNAKEEKGQTALHGAAFWGFTELARFLAEHGAKLDARDNKGMTPIDSAMGRAGGNGFSGTRIDVHQDTADLLKKLMGSSGPTAQVLKK
jgi:ankyrin repeat protein